MSTLGLAGPIRYHGVSTRHGLAEEDLPGIVLVDVVLDVLTGMWYDALVDLAMVPF